MSTAAYVIGTAMVVLLVLRLRARLRLSRAKHPSLTGHARLARRIAKLVPFYSYDNEHFFCSDDAPADVVARRRHGFEALGSALLAQAPRTVHANEQLEAAVSDVLFTNTYRVPFQYRELVRRTLKVGALVEETSGTRVRDLDGNWSYDLTGSYGVNVFGYDFYKECIDAGIARVRKLGPVLGPYHPLIADNVARLRAISELDEVSFHMSGTEAVMQAVRLAQFHTGRRRIVVFCGAYHGWWDGVQPGIGNPRGARDVYTLRDMSPASLDVLASRNDIACVLVNPLQSLHPNGSAPGDSTLIDSSRGARFDRSAYSAWLAQLRDVCSRRSIALIFDEVFVGFRLARGGAQEYFGVRADIVTYGKTVGGGLPIGVVCGRSGFMKRFRAERPSDICFARGTFNSHPYVMAAMNEFLRRLDEPSICESYARLDAVCSERVASLNRRLEEAALPVKVVHFASIWTITYLVPSRYNWMFQYYLRLEGLALSWVGTGRLILSHNFSDADFEAVADRFVRAANSMHADGWWWSHPKLTNRSIKRRVLREILACWMHRRGAAPRAAGGQPAVPISRSPSASTSRSSS